MADDPLRLLKDDIQRLLGKCLIQLQSCELHVKAILGKCDVSYSDGSPEPVETPRNRNLTRDTLGNLIGEFVGSYFVSEEKHDSLQDDWTAGRPGEVNVRLHVPLPDDEHARLTIALRELVDLRNNLVHHFISDYDLATPEGCETARDALVSASARILKYHALFRSWWTKLNDMRETWRITLQSKAVRKAVQKAVVHGIGTDGKVIWHFTGAVRALREASDALAVDGWTLISTAETWISKRYPDEQPALYGCTSWAQVLHESGKFEIQRFAIGGQRQRYYRVKAPAAPAT